ncbi:MAG: methylated-DNA--[protein]-cysteine S-methyltransferase [Solirubrobacteraceae bacterium]
MSAFVTALGRCGIAWSDVGVTDVALPGIRLRAPGASEVPDAVRDAIAGIIALLDGERRDLREVVLDQSGLSEFDRAVYAATRAVGPGATAGYGEIARAIGAGPDSARAVGAALGRNPFPIVVPCHRILAADGTLHGFSAPGGIDTKRRMLQIERAPGFTQEALFA